MVYRIPHQFVGSNTLRHDFGDFCDAICRLTPYDGAVSEICLTVHHGRCLPAPQVTWLETLDLLRLRRSFDEKAPEVAAVSYRWMHISTKA